MPGLRAQQPSPELIYDCGKEFYSSADNTRFSADGRYMALWNSTINRIKIYDVFTGLPVNTISGENNYAFVHFSAGLQYVRYNRLPASDKEMNDPDTVGYEAVHETFTGKELFKRKIKHASAGGDPSVGLAGDCMLIEGPNHSLQIQRIGVPEDTLSLDAWTWRTSEDEKFLMVRGSYEAGVLSLVDLSTLKVRKIHPGHIAESQKTEAEKADLRDHKYSTFSLRGFTFSGDARYLVFTRESFSAKTDLVSVIDIAADTVIFNRSCPHTEYGDEIFWQPVTFSSASLVLTMPDKEGMKVFNIKKGDSVLLPFKKQQTAINILPDKSGNYLTFWNSGFLKVYNVAAGKMELEIGTTVNDKSVKDGDKNYIDKVYANDKYPLLYISSRGKSVNSGLSVYDLVKKTFTDSTNGEVVAIAHGGSILYARLGYRYALVNERLQPIKYINNCTPETGNIVATDDPDIIATQLDGMCEFSMHKTGKQLFFWDISKCVRLTNQGSHLVEDRLLDVGDLTIYNKDIYVRGYDGIECLNDTMKFRGWCKTCGDLLSLNADYSVFSKGQGMPDLFSDAVWGDTITIFKTFTDEQVGKFILPKAMIVAATMDKKNKRVLTLSNSLANLNAQVFLLQVWDMAGKKLKEIKLDHSVENITRQAKIEFTDNDKYVTITDDPAFGPHAKNIYSAATGARLLAGTTLPRRTVISDAKNKIAWADGDGFDDTLRIRSINPPQKIKDIPGRVLQLQGNLALISFVSKDVKRELLFFPAKSTTALVNWTTGDTLFRRSVDNDFFAPGAISPDGQWIAFANKTYQVILVNIPAKKVTDTFSSADYLRSIAFTSDSKRLITASTDGTVRAYPVNGRKKELKLINFGENGYMAANEQGYYRASKDALAMFGYRAGAKSFTATQFDIRYNRPDLLLKTCGDTGSKLCDAYYKAYLKRLGKAGLTESDLADSLHVPELAITNRGAIPLFTDSQAVTIAFEATDTRYNIDRCFVSVNDVPVYGRKGIVAENKGKELHKTIAVRLTPGVNKIQLSCRNEKGIESLHETIRITSQPGGQPSPPHIYFVGIGANRFANSRYNLQYSAKDIRNLCAAMKEKYGNNVDIDTLIDEQVSAAAVTALKKKLLGSSVNDKVIIAYSGHGLLSRDYDYYLSTYHINFNDPADGGLPYDALEDLVDSIPARRRMLLIDACNSGEVDKAELMRMRREENTMVAKKGLDIFIDDSAKLGSESAFTLMQDLFVNAGKNTGATVIAASAGTQFALEKDELKNGVFTFCVMEYMKQHDHANVNELKQYVNHRVSELTNGLQAPTTREENPGYDWQLW